MEEKNTFPLSLSQKNIWDLEKAYPGTSINNISTTVKIRGRIDFVLLQKSIQLVLEADPSLRMQITLENEEPVQYCVPYEMQNFEIYDFSNTDQEGIHSWETAISHEVLPVLDAPLYRFVLYRSGENSGGVFVKLHHIISDGWSQMLVCSRIGQIYLELLSGSEPDLDEIPEYWLHVQDEQDYLESKAYQRDKKYWEQVVNNFSEPSVIKTMNSAAVSPVGRRVSYQLPHVLNHAIYSYCVKNRVAPFAVFYMALAIYFRRIGGADRFTIGVPIVNRTSFKFKQSTGMFVNTLPFYNEICDEWTLDEFNESLMESWYELLRHQRFPFSHIAALNEQQDGRLFHIALSYQDSTVAESRDASVVFTGRWHYSGYQAEQLCIHLGNLENRRQYTVDYDYLTQYFSEKEIRYFHENIVNILMEALHNPQIPICRLAILGREERERVLYTFNRTDKLINETGLYDLFREVVREYPNRAAVICGGERMTYLKMDEQSAWIAGGLRSVLENEKGVIAVLLPRDSSLYCSIVGVLRSGNAYLLLSPELPVKRLCRILEQSKASALITCSNYKEQTEIKNLQIPVLDVDQMIRKKEEYAPAIENPDDLAYVVYTSGSTGEPKGVEITRRNVQNLVEAMEPVYGKGAVLSVCNVGFDAFVLESIAALLNGRTIVLPMDEELESPSKLAELIVGYAVGFISITPSRLQAFLKEEKFVRAMRLMESVVCGGEAFSSELLKQLQNCSNARIYNQYGPSETTVGVTLKELNQSGLITAGSPMQNCRLYILDQWMNPLPVGVYGQLYISGICVGNGYRNDPELTELRFIDNPFEQGETMYATGDSACWTETGEIVLAGRMDRQVKLRGLRVEPQEVSSCIASYPGVKDAAAKVSNIQGQNVLIGYYCADMMIPETELLTFVASYLPKYMIPAVIMRLDEIPLSGSGKLLEEKLPLPELVSGGKSMPTSKLQMEILEVFKMILKHEEIGVDDNYFLCGGNSLNAMEVIAELESRFGQRLRIADLYACRTARRVAEYYGDVQTCEPYGRSQFVLQAAPKLEYYPLSPIQQGIYVQSCMDPEGLAYHMPGAFVLEEKPDLDKLEEAFRCLIKEEPIFRTAFVQKDQGVYAVVSDEVPFELQRMDCGSFEEAIRLFVVPFSFDESPLLRAAVWERPDGRWVLFIDVHHIIGDGMSTPLVLAALEKYYQGAEQTIAELGYHDYAYAMMKAKEEDTADQEYWKEHLEPLPDPLMLPTDYPRNKQFDFKGGSYHYVLSTEAYRSSKVLCENTGISPYMLFLGAYGILLSAVSGKQEMLIGTPVSGRVSRQLQQLCGPFINMMPLRIQVDKEQEIVSYLQDIRREVTEMMEHLNCSLEEMVSMFHLERTVSGNPLYQAAFSMRPFGELDFIIAGKSAEYLPIHSGGTKCDLFIELVETKEGYELQFEYATSMFEETTIQLYARCMNAIIQGMTDCSVLQIKDLPLLDMSDQAMLIDEPNYNYMPYQNQPIHQIIRNRSRMYPADTAIIFHGAEITYRELDQQAGRIAGMLLSQDVKKGEIIGLYMKRTPDYFAAMLGVLKAGCAYMPLSVSLPQQRMAYMLETAGVGKVIADQQTEGIFDDSIQIFGLPKSDEAYREDVSVNGNDLIHVLFTSGSTGRPKGVMLRHRNISNLYSNMKMVMEEIRGAVLCTANVMFDIFIVESLFALAMGDTVILADEEEMMLPWKLAQLMSQHHVEMVQMTASRLSMCLSNENFSREAANLKVAIVGGENLTESLAERFREVSSGKLFNMYGPTEAAVTSTMEEIIPGRSITIGKPLHNYRVYILDENQKPVIPTACGEIFLAGEGIADGYIGKPELTEEAFFEDCYDPNQKMYKTGDMGRLRADGRIEFLGRQDDQVKINGQRVELSEITAAITASSYVKQAAVVILKKPDGASEIIGFYENKENECHVQEIHDYLREYLPEYMLPSALYEVEEIPMNANGKTDLKKLKELAETGALKKEVQHEEKKETETVAFLDSEVRVMLGIWEAVLGKSEVRSDISFFEQGGTSLGALSVLSRYFNIGLEMTMSQFYEHPTIEDQLRFVYGANSLTKKEAKPQYPVQVPKNTMKTEKSIKEECVFLTGATGFFGVHLLKELLSDNVAKVICLVRGSEERLLDAISWYFGAGYARGIKGKLEIITGDLSAPYFGWDEAAFMRVAARIDAVYHCAADVRHYTSDEEAYMASNVQGTKTIIQLAVSAGVTLHHISTGSISGDYLIEKPEEIVTFTENDFYIGQNWQDNVYVKSKFLAESEVYKAMEQGLHAHVYRLGRIVNRTSDYLFQRNPDTNTSYLLMKAIKVLGILPVKMAEMPVDLTPVDWCAAAVRALKNSEGTAYHLMNECPPILKEIAQHLNDHLQIVPDDAYASVLIQHMTEDNEKILAPLLNHWQQTRVGDSKVIPDCQITKQALEDAHFVKTIPEAEELICGLAAMFE